MPVRRPVAPLPPPDQDLHPVHLQPPPATWSRLDSRNLRPRGPRARRHHRRRRREAKEAGSRREATREAEFGWDITEKSEAFLFLCFNFTFFFCSGHSFKHVKPKVPPVLFYVTNLFCFFKYRRENIYRTVPLKLTFSCFVKAEDSFLHVVLTCDLLRTQWNKATDIYSWKVQTMETCVFCIVTWCSWLYCSIMICHICKFL